jgi:hypothetical protein
MGDGPKPNDDEELAHGGNGGGKQDRSLSKVVEGEVVRQERVAR